MLSPCNHSNSILQRKPIYDDFESVALSPAPKAPSTIPRSVSEHPANVDAEDQLERKEDEERKKKQQLLKESRGPTPTDRLAVQIGKARMALYRAAVATEDKVNETMDCAFNFEQSFTKSVASLAPPRESGEKLMPGAIYVLVAAMAGSIVTRNRNILLRATVPLAMGVGAGWTVLPYTMRNVSDATWKFEQRFPAVAEQHLKIREGLESGVSFAKAHGRVGVQYVDDKVTDAREVVEGWVKQGK